MTAANEALQKYLAALGTSFEELASAATKASDRGTKLSKQFSDEVIAAQKEAIKLASKIAADPDHMLTASVSALTEAAVTGQTRALAFAQMAYQEAVSSGTEGRTLTESVAKANQATTDAALELAKSWAAFSPTADFWVKSVEATMKAAGAKS
jgi:hypothetical protein